MSIEVQSPTTGGQANGQAAEHRDLGDIGRLGTRPALRRAVNSRAKPGSMSTRATGRIVGVLFLLGIALYGTGSVLVASGSGTSSVLSHVTRHQMQISIGALLMLANSAVVAGIGVLLFPVLKAKHEISAHAYLIARAIEAVMTAVGIVFLLLLIPLGQEYARAAASDAPALQALARVAQTANHYAYEIAMISLGAGGLLLCRVLFRARLVPRFIAAWGLVGYASLLNGAILEVLGYGAGVALSIPGGLFEVGLGLLLVVKGFPMRQSRDDAHAASRTA